MITKFPYIVTDLIYKPKWLKNVLALRKSAYRFLNYKRDLLEDDQIHEIKASLSRLDTTIRNRDREGAKAAADNVESTCQIAMPRYKAPSGLKENVEVFLVTIIITLGLRAYIVQPFRIPTGSMQPTLNGIQSFTQPKDEWPSLPVRLAQRVTKGRNYIYVEAEQDIRLRTNNLAQCLVERQSYQFFTFTDILLAGGGKITVNASRQSILDANGLNLPGNLAQIARDQGRRFDGRIPKGSVLLSGYSDSGDMILVDRVSYHFRKPERGEVFVFDTRGISGVHQVKDRAGRLVAQQGGFNYIKRLAGVPGDTLTIGGADGKDGYLYIDGERAAEPGFIRVAEDEPAYPAPGYSLGSTLSNAVNPPIIRPGDSLELAANTKDPIMEEYAALGDNSGNSLDSRYWGSVKEYNLVGKAWFSLWPFTSGHWGFID